ncbi:ceramide kinase isoform X2 [Amia ocellicauda]|uniref:ceramide kinase isoform X2 n=1 Tax=Amia ocellicauda TaxID=2972642 RepID=UPI00346432A4
MTMEGLQSSLWIGKKKHWTTLCAKCLSWTPMDRQNRKNKDKSRVVPVSEVVAVQEGIMEFLPYRKVQVSERDFTVLFVQRSGHSPRWTLGRRVFSAPSRDLRELWVSALRTCLQQHIRCRPQRLLVFINPFGGRGHGRKIYQSQVSPLFELAGISTHVLETERANHARDHILKKDLSGFDGLVCVGGDGMFSELMHGLIGRTQQEAGISENDPSATLEPCSLRIGIIPAGSTDCVCFATVGVNDPVTSALHIIIGDSQPLDVCSVHHRDQLMRYSVSLVGYGFYGDVLEESDRHRWMGPVRYDYSGVMMFLSNRSYQGTVEFQLAGNQLTSPRDKTRCLSGCQVCSASREWLCSVSDLSFDTISQDSFQTPGGSTEEGASSPWRSVEGRFRAVSLTCMSSACPKSPAGLSPSAHLADGTADLILVRDCSPCGFLTHLSRHTNSKDQFDLPFVDVYRVKALRFTPPCGDEDEEEGEVERGREPSSQRKKRHLCGGGCGDAPPRSCWNCDGEVLPHSAILARVHCQLVRLFARGIEGPFRNQRDGRRRYR